MLHVELLDNGGTGSELKVILRLFYDQSSDPGVAHIQLRNQRNFLVFDDKPSNCPSLYSQSVPNLTTSDPPFSLTVWGCPEPDGGVNKSEHTGLLPQENLCRPGRMLSPSQACLDAQARATQYANAASAACDQARLARADRDYLKATAQQVGIAAGVMGAAALAANAIPVIGWMIATALALIAAALFIAAAIFGAKADDANTRYLGELAVFNTNRVAYRKEMLVVNGACCPEQIHVPSLGDCAA